MALAKPLQLHRRTSTTTFGHVFGHSIINGCILRHGIGMSKGISIGIHLGCGISLGIGHIMGIGIGLYYHY